MKSIIVFTSFLFFIANLHTYSQEKLGLNFGVTKRFRTGYSFEIDYSKKIINQLDFF